MTTALQQIGSTLRSMRTAQALSQEVLAAKAGISRSTLIQIEQGKDAQASSIEKVASVLGAVVGCLPETPELSLRRQARAELAAKQASSREKHLKIAVRLALEGEEAAKLIADALRMVAMWRERALCSPVYIERWQQMLDAEPRQVAQNILGLDDEWGPALRQNTPFAVAAP